MNDNPKGLWPAGAAGISLILAIAGCSHIPSTHVAFTHTTPGTAVDVALARKAEPVPTPTPVPTPQPGHQESSAAETTTESIADYFTLGNLMMQQGKYPEAIKAFENAVRLDPTFAEAWNHLAICYQDAGQGEKAVEAFKRYKSISEPQPPQQ